MRILDFDKNQNYYFLIVVIYNYCLLLVLYQEDFIIVDKLILIDNNDVVFKRILLLDFVKRYKCLVILEKFLLDMKNVKDEMRLMEVEVFGIFRMIFVLQKSDFFCIINQWIDLVDLEKLCLKGKFELQKR